MHIKAKRIKKGLDGIVKILEVRHLPVNLVEWAFDYGWRLCKEDLPISDEDILTPREIEFGKKPTTVEEIFATANNKKKQLEYCLISFKGSIPKNLKPFIGVGSDSKNREAFIRILIGAWNLLEKFDLPCKLIAAQIGVSPATVSRYLREMQARNLLTCVDSSYIIKIKAKSYKATWMLATAIAEAKAAYDRKPNKTNLPTRVIPGSFFLQMMSSLCFFSKIEDFQAWLNTLDGMDAFRFRKAMRWARYEFKHLERRMRA